MTKFSPQEAFRYYLNEPLLSFLRCLAKDLEDDILDRYDAHYTSIQLRELEYTESYFNDYGNSAILYLELSISQNNTLPNTSSYMKSHFSMPLQIQAYPYRSLSFDPFLARKNKIPKDQFKTVKYVSGDLLDILMRGTNVVTTRNKGKLLWHIDEQLQRKLFIGKKL